jgi:XTP/dITP diphosphohydrolase
VIATGNAGKIAEFRSMLAGSDYQAVAPAGIGLQLDVDETGDSYAANALLKAQAYAEASGLPVLADDSGLEVDALAGQPGIRSARYGGPGLTDQQRVALILDKLTGVPPAARTARFRCALALLDPGGRLWQADGTVEGAITTEPRGENGFGYDPIFLLPDLGRTAAELTEEEKNRLSHRARALAELLTRLQREPL